MLKIENFRIVKLENESVQGVFLISVHVSP